MTVPRIVYACVAVIVLSLTPTVARAVIFNDSFSTNPYPTRWCERVHHLHWDSANLLVSGVNGTSCTPTTNSCCATCVPGSFGDCTGTNINGFLGITKTDYVGDDRNVSADFAMQVAFTKIGTLAEHAALFSAVHPNCHVGIEAIVASSSPSPGQFLQIIVAEEQLAGHPECVNNAQLSPAQAVNLATSTLPRYKLKLHTYLPSPPPSLYTILRTDLIDNQTGLTLATSATSITKPSWYNNQARRYGLGAVEYISSGGVIPWDNFTSDAH